MNELFAIFGTGVALTLLVGFYSVLASTNLIRTLIGLEILAKAVTLLIILVGYRMNQLGLAQSLAITMIIIEVAVMVVAVGVVLGIFRHDKSIETSNVKGLKG